MKEKQMGQLDFFFKLNMLKLNKVRSFISRAAGSEVLKLLLDMMYGLFS